MTRCADTGLVLVALPTTLYSSGSPFNVSSNCPASEIGTLKYIWYVPISARLTD